MKDLLLKWFINGSVGISSQTMASAFIGERIVDYHSIPYDISDFNRCFYMSIQVGATNEDLKKVSDMYPYWTPFIENWGELCSLKFSSDKNKLHERIKELVKESNSIRQPNDIGF